MSSIEQQAKGKKDGEIRYLTPLNIETSKVKKYCRFKTVSLPPRTKSLADAFVSLSKVLSGKAALRAR